VQQRRHHHEQAISHADRRRTLDAGSLHGELKRDDQSRYTDVNMLINEPRLNRFID